MKVCFPWTHIIMLMCRLVALNSVPLTDASLIYNPRKDVKLCGRGGRPSWICDPSSVLSREEADELDHALDDIRTSTPCKCNPEQLCNTTTSARGFTVSIAILPYLPSSRQDPVTVRNFADYLRKKTWRFGKCGDDVVIVASEMEKQVYASSGPASALKLRSLVTEDIYADTRQFFEEGDFYTGLKIMVASFHAAFEDSYYITPDFPVWPVVQMAIGALFVLVCFCSMYLCRKLYS